MARSGPVGPRLGHSLVGVGRGQRPGRSRGRLDAEAVRDVLAAAGHHVKPVLSVWPAGLTEREVAASAGRDPPRGAAGDLPICHSPTGADRYQEWLAGALIRMVLEPA